MKHTNTIDQQYRYGVGDRIHEQSPNTLLLQIFFQPGFNRNSTGWASLRHKRNFWALQWIFNSRIIALQRNAPGARFCLNQWDLHHEIAPANVSENAM